METINILGYNISNGGLLADADTAWRMILSGVPGRYMACANPHSIVTARVDPDFRLALKSADLLLPDGSGILVAARGLGLPMQERVAGFEFFGEIARRAQAQGGQSFFFLGSTPLVLERLTARLARDFPAIRVAGSCSPPFRDSFTEAENAEMCRQINESGASVLWVGMTAPKQEKWLRANCHRLQPAFSGAIGAVFDFYAGTSKRAPQWVRNLGLEWLPRLLRNPRRLWQRNFVSSPLFLSMVMRERLRLRAN
ncbi:MAG TPA: WecB/TagA/CpsF family glycosyltransferase [Patescibacteria group bacterium]|nr:WecB/TagA/CpsF family glycosyltransferase [Patescibacteria group bacterium]